MNYAKINGFPPAAADEQMDRGIRLLCEAGNLLASAHNSDSPTEALDLMLLALNQDLEALSMMYEATLFQKQAIENLCEYRAQEQAAFEAGAPPQSAVRHLFPRK